MPNKGEAQPQGQVENQVKAGNQPDPNRGDQDALPPDPTANHRNTPPDPNQEPGTLQPGQVEGDQLPQDGTQNAAQQVKEGQPVEQGTPDAQ